MFQRESWLPVARRLPNEKTSSEVTQIKRSPPQMTNRSRSVSMTALWRKSLFDQNSTRGSAPICDHKDCGLTQGSSPMAKTCTLRSPQARVMPISAARSPSSIQTQLSKLYKKSHGHRPLHHQEPQNSTCWPPFLHKLGRYSMVPMNEAQDANQETFLEELRDNDRFACHSRQIRMSPFFSDTAHFLFHLHLRPKEAHPSFYEATTGSHNSFGQNTTGLELKKLDGPMNYGWCLTCCAHTIERKRYMWFGATSRVPTCSSAKR